MRETLSIIEEKLESKSISQVVRAEHQGEIEELRTKVDSLISSEQQKLQWDWWSDIGKPLFWLAVLIGYFKCIKPAEQDEIKKHQLDTLNESAP